MGLDLDPFHLSARRAVPRPAHNGVHRGGFTLHCGFYAAVAAVAHPARDPQSLRFASHRVAEEHTLHAAMDHEAQRFFGHSPDSHFSGCLQEFILRVTRLKDRSAMQFQGRFFPGYPCPSGLQYPKPASRILPCLPVLRPVDRRQRGTDDTLSRNGLTEGGKNMATRIFVNLPVKNLNRSAESFARPALRSILKLLTRQPLAWLCPKTYSPWLIRE